MIQSQMNEEIVSINDRLGEKLDSALAALSEAKSFAKSTYQTDVFQIAETMMQSLEGFRTLYARAHTFDECGVFEGGPWVDPGKLLPSLVAGSLKAGGVYPIVESLSELRMLAIAKGTQVSDTVSAEEALDFLNEVMALNLEYIFPRETEENRLAAGPQRDACIYLFQLLCDELGMQSLCADVVSEIEQISAQRPVSTGMVCSMIDMAADIPTDDTDAEVEERLALYTRALKHPSAISSRSSDVAVYRQALKGASREALEQEAAQFADSMRKTGLVSPYHAVLLRHLRSQQSDLIPLAMQLNELGTAEFAQNEEFVLRLIRVAILPTTAQSIYGLAKTLEFGILSRNEIRGGLLRMIDLDLQADVKKNLQSLRKSRDGVTANSRLLAGMISVLGQPLGVGQGNNPTCQAARAISLWAQYAQGYLLNTVISAARDGFVEMNFEGETLRSDQLTGGFLPRLDRDSDPVSVVLVPHMDRLYDAMMKRVALRPEDGHKWVNPALYGRWVSSGFCSVFTDRAQTTVADYDDFLRRFYATHHPAYNEDHPLVYPNPVGILVTNSHGDCLGAHAVSIQRIEEDPHGELRAYFYNPNNEGRQDWGLGVKPSIRGNGELEGESSLPFHQFAARLYAFHYNPYEEGDAYAVPDETITQIQDAAQQSWGRSYTWL